MRKSHQNSERAGPPSEIEVVPYCLDDWPDGIHKCSKRGFDLLF